jgi:hypothetical protein
MPSDGNEIMYLRKEPQMFAKFSFQEGLHNIFYNDKKWERIKYLTERNELIKFCYCQIKLYSQIYLHYCVKKMGFQMMPILQFHFCKEKNTCI